MNLSADKLSGLFFLVFGLLLYFVVIPAYVEQVDGSNLAPNTLPNAVSLVISLCGLVLFVKPTEWKIQNTRVMSRALLYVVVIAAGVYAMSWFGFAVVAPVLAIVIMFLVGERRPFWLLCGTVGAPVFIWLFVVQLLDRPLP